MNKLLQYIKEQWDQSGECNSCGWHASLGEYDLPDDITIDINNGEIHLPCLNKDDEDRSSHRGVTIYFNYTKP